MIDVEYQMPDFDEERRLAHPLGIKDSGDWSQDGQSLYIDKVKTHLLVHNREFWLNEGTAGESSRKTAVTKKCNSK